MVKEEEEIIWKQKVKERKALALIRKVEKEEEQIQKKLLIEKTRATKAAERQAQLELKETARKERMEELQLQEESRRATKTNKERKKSINQPTIILEEEKEEEVELVTSKGRSIQCPKRFKQ